MNVRIWDASCGGLDVQQGCMVEKDETKVSATILVSNWHECAC
jgi:hypothetical protein